MRRRRAASAWRARARRRNIVERGVGEPSGESARGPIRVGGRAGGFGGHVVTGLSGTRHLILLRRDVQSSARVSRKMAPDERSGRFTASPQQAMTELVAIKGDPRVKIGNAEQVIVEFSKQGVFQGSRRRNPD